MASFGTAAFEEVGDNDGSGYSFASSVNGQRLIVPGGSRIIVQRNYAAAHTLETQALCSYAELEALRGKVGQSDYLTLQQTGGAAFLLSVAPSRVFDSSCYVVDLAFRYSGSINVPGQTGGGYGSFYGSNKDGM
jgi:hypothetical protein